MNNPQVQRAVAGSPMHATRLRPDVYESLVRQLPKPMLTPGQNDPQYAAFLLGIQHVLGLLRDGFVA